ncbi:MAG: phytase [Vicinamibacterales bacterium]
MRRRPCRGSRGTSATCSRPEPARSRIIATTKEAAPHGGLAVFSLDGHIEQLVPGLDRPNNVDVVEYGLDLDGSPTDIVVATERLARRLRIYATAHGQPLRDVVPGGLPILEGAEGDEGAPMGVALYRRPGDGAIFAIVAPKAGPKTGYLWQYALHDDSRGHVTATFVRRFGHFSGAGEIEAVAVDDELGFVYYADEQAGIHKWLADPDAAGADRELAVFGTSGYHMDREGLGIYSLPGGRGYLVSVDQLPGESVFHVYSREGAPGRPHDHTEEVLQFRIGADSTDGLEVTSAPLGTAFPDGLLVAMNSARRNFLLVPWHAVATNGRPDPLTP